MQVAIKKWGNSLGIRIPQNILNSLHLRENQSLNIEIENGNILIKPITRELESLLAQITPKNIHNEISFGTAEGEEIW
ncbi:AbrB/MazE/SpoVT family DNA-binding domain-containing protein [Francisella philomiragia]|uniref:AbrB/MazE/SpoVT family DNA-binding domain-containing protein n=1 Tax=Francisella TaxID=262 RepID=UPI0019076C99|nr:AbrB/MazE/SpoVT family DNA-binding domain-containing protein [Francisella philomiragia]MBK2341744.1 AbrB/MazE/SpoVT family DNA-binding domain-containing protein [Francisella philomiragia]